MADYVLNFPALAARIQNDPVVVDAPYEEDSDVVAETQRVTSMSAAENGDIVRLQCLRKVYQAGGRTKVAVKSLSFGIPMGECFGFLGINGAGKTSTLNMLTGAVLPSSGDAWIGGHHILREQASVRRLIGYCPQHDALLDLLSVREHVLLFGRIKGVPEAKLGGFVDNMLQDLDLKAHEFKLANQLSGGNKRKLSVAIALIGGPQLVFLDEPSTGVDPGARREMWGVISSLSTMAKACSVVLTTHNMEEAEALCGRIGIMVGGRLRCIGSSQRLKSRYAEGYQLELKLAPSIDTAAEQARLNLPPMIPAQQLAAACAAVGDPTLAQCITPQHGIGSGIYQALQNHGGELPAALLLEWANLQLAAQRCLKTLASKLSGIELIERHERVMRFRIFAETTLSSLFETIEAEKVPLQIEEYSVSQATLEQIFNQFAAQQEEETGPVAGMVSAGTVGAE